MALTKLNFGGTGQGSIATQVTSNLPSGSVLQVVQQTLNPTSGTTSGTSSFATYITKAITPSSSSSKVLILATLNAYTQYSGWDGPQHGSKLLRGSTHIAGNNFFHSRANVNANKYQSVDHNISFLDSPSSSSEVTYNLQARYSNGSGITFYNGFMTLMEIKG